MDTKLKQQIAKANLATNSNVGTISQRANKNKEKIEKLKTFDLLFSWQNFFGDDDFQNMFVLQPTFNMLEGV